MVPMLDVIVQMPGASPEEVEQRVSLSHGEAAARGSRGRISLLDQPTRHEHGDRALLCGTKEEDAIVQTYNKLYSNFDRIPPGVSQPIIKVRSINDVPILALTLWGKNYDSYHLRRIAGELENSLKQIDNVSETTMIGGQPRQIRVVLDTQAGGLWANARRRCRGQLQAANTRADAGSFARDNREFQVEAGRFFTRPEDLQQVVVGVHWRPSGLSCAMSRRRWKTVPPSRTTMFMFAKAAWRYRRRRRRSATISGGNDHACQAQRHERHDHRRTCSGEGGSLRGYLLPADLNVTVTRNYGETAKDKSNELLKHLLIATLSVTC